MDLQCYERGEVIDRSRCTNLLGDPGILCHIWLHRNASACRTCASLPNKHITNWFKCCWYFTFRNGSKRSSCAVLTIAGACSSIKLISGCATTTLLSWFAFSRSALRLEIGLLASLPTAIESEILCSETISWVPDVALNALLFSFETISTLFIPHFCVPNDTFIQIVRYSCLLMKLHPHTRCRRNRRSWWLVSWFIDTRRRCQLSSTVNVPMSIRYAIYDEILRRGLILR